MATFRYIPLVALLTLVSPFALAEFRVEHAVGGAITSNSSYEPANAYLDLTGIYQHKNW
ncbi:MAG: hypothetical protein ACI93R_002020 [Flavobacteriales bacterium]|jgi:hypothetical protein